MINILFINKTFKLDIYIAFLYFQKMPKNFYTSFHMLYMLTLHNVAIKYIEKIIKKIKIR